MRRPVAFVLTAVLLCLGGCRGLVDVLDFGFTVQEQTEDLPTFTSLPEDLCARLGRATSWIGDTPSDPDGRRRPELIECRWSPLLTPAQATVLIIVTQDQTPAVANARKRFDFLLNANVCGNLLVSTCERYRKDRKFRPLPHGDRACGYTANPQSVNHIGVIRRGNVVALVDIQTRATSTPAAVADLVSTSDSPVRAVLAEIDRIFVPPPPPPPDRNRVFPLSEPKNDCKPAS
ncbi:MULTISPECIES: hypothetical protein [unclassified Crossiella]|uniref:hypothetical protein n=1 Tax=unclassified Crossiella TaxID=2620835 RepID=UPI001FFF3E42|nr:MULTISPECIES: hypothetical protein [unclassified Crossiella]MCK2243572.1 hypothetical protein [Crossiella sp. S99.2]MCK2257430.1 hypothetical protein [Crossiella sp. S99.1]